MNRNALYIREIIEKTNHIPSIRVEGNNRTEIKENVLSILRQQRQKPKNQNARTQTY